MFMDVVIGQGITVSPVPNWCTSFSLASIWPTIMIYNYLKSDFEKINVILLSLLLFLLSLSLLYMIIYIIIIIALLSLLLLLLLYYYYYYYYFILFLFIYLFIFFFFFGGGGGGAAVYNGRLYMYIQENWWWIKMKLVNMGRCKND